MSELYEGWENGIPPKHWKRLLSFDVGGATANNLEWVAVDPDSQSIVFYDEVRKITTDMEEVANMSLPKMKPEGSDTEYEFIAKVGDYENRIALADMARYGIKFTNAVKQNKIFSVHRLAGYLHQNPKRPYPAWHPLAGQLGAPLMFITSRCPRLIEEIPLQKWKNDAKGTTTKDELDRAIKHDAVDCALYIARLMPAPITIPVPKVKPEAEKRSLQSILYWADVKKHKESESGVQARRQYTPNHSGGTEKWHISS